MPIELSADSPVSFDYAAIRVVPRVDRLEFINVGVILFCRRRNYLHARTHLDRQRLSLFALESIDPVPIERSLEVFVAICRGEGPIGQLPRPDRFHWLISPRSTIVQTSPVHVGLCTDPAATLERLFDEMAGGK